MKYISIARLLDLYLRIFMLMFALFAALIVLAAGAHAATAVSLKPAGLIAGESLTVGDIFSGLPADKASYILGPGPAPGKDMVLDARSLMRIAIALDMPWRPDSSATSITVRRDATVIGKDQIDAGLREALLSEGLDGSFDMNYSTGTPQIAMNPGLPMTFDVTALAYDRTKDTFTATLSAPSADDPQTVITVGGVIAHKVQIPVLRTTLKNGSLINERDLEMIEIFARELQPDMIIDAETAVGLTPRRVIAAGKPLRGIDLETPQLVSRGDNVTLVFDSSPLYLTAKGKALQSGGKGDLVRVVNVASNRSIEGLVSGSGQITVTP